ncbi:MAG: sugar phosphate isomerase/epimerase family protein [bacterium]
MRLGINNSIWEITGISLHESLDKINSLGFRYVDVLACGSSDPRTLNQPERRKIAYKFKDLGLTSSGMVMLVPGNIASPDSKERENCLSYLRSCAEFQAELGGRQVLLGFGGGWKTLETGREEAWVNAVNFIKDYCEWLSDFDIFLTLELDPSVYFVINDTTSMAKMIEQVDAPNLFANIDIGHLAITREPPRALEKLKDKVLHVHISDNDGKAHANWIIGRGVTRVPDYLRKLIEMGIDETCARYNEAAVASLELGEIGQKVKDPDQYVQESLEYLCSNVPEITK